jgi:hypothetical protein
LYTAAAAVAAAAVLVRNMPTFLAGQVAALDKFPLVLQAQLT